MAPHDAEKLDACRTRLDAWWEAVAEPKRRYLTEHRDKQLSSEYASVVQSAGEPMPDDETLRMPPMVRVYVEMKAQHGEAGKSQN